MAAWGSSPQPLLSCQSWYLEAEAASSALGQEQGQAKVIELALPLSPLYHLSRPPPIHTDIHTQFHLAYLSLFRA